MTGRSASHAVSTKRKKNDRPGRTRQLFLVLLFIAGRCRLSKAFHQPRPQPAWISSVPMVRPFAVRSFTFGTAFRHASTQLRLTDLQDPDFLEELIGGRRYEMVPLPDSMMETTLFVGNLNEFVKDEDLSNLFQNVSILRSVPACVVRKANYESLRYGFVAFPNVEEKEAAIVRFHGSEWKGKTIKVEEIRDHPKMGRVRVPESIVSYVSGAAKPTRSGEVNTMRRSRATNKNGKSKQQFSSAHAKKKHTQRKKSKKRSRFATFPVTDLVNGDLQEFYRASRKGFVTLPGTGYRRGRKSCALANTHRQWCDERRKPQIVLCKASGGRPLDNIIVDLSPLRLPDEDGKLVEWKTQILLAAHNAGMQLRSDYLEDNCIVLSSVVTSEMDEILAAADGSHDRDSAANDASQANCQSVMQDKGASIYDLPVMSIGVFEGERSRAKAMARELAHLWETHEEPQAVESTNGRYKNKQRKKKSHRRRGRNLRDLQWYI